MWSHCRYTAGCQCEAISKPWQAHCKHVVYYLQLFSDDERSTRVARAVLPGHKLLAITLRRPGECIAKPWFMHCRIKWQIHFQTMANNLQKRGWWIAEFPKLQALESNAWEVLPAHKHLANALWKSGECIAKQVQLRWRMSHQMHFQTLASMLQKTGKSFADIPDWRVVVWRGAVHEHRYLDSSAWYMFCKDLVIALRSHCRCVAGCHGITISILWQTRCKSLAVYLQILLQDKLNLQVRCWIIANTLRVSCNSIAKWRGFPWVSHAYVEAGFWANLIDSKIGVFGGEELKMHCNYVASYGCEVSSPI